MCLTRRRRVNWRALVQLNGESPLWHVPQCIPHPGRSWNGRRTTLIASGISFSCCANGNSPHGLTRIQTPTHTHTRKEGESRANRRKPLRRDRVRRWLRDLARQVNAIEKARLNLGRTLPLHPNPPRHPKEAER